MLYFQTKKEAAIRLTLFVISNVGVYAFLWSITKLVNG